MNIRNLVGLTILLSGLYGCGGGGDPSPPTTPPDNPGPPTPPQTSTVVLPYFSFDSMAAPAKLGFWNTATNAVADQWTMTEETTPRLAYTYPTAGGRVFSGVVAEKANKLQWVSLPDVTSTVLSPHEVPCDIDYYPGGRNHPGIVIAEFAGPDKQCDNANDNFAEMIDLKTRERAALNGHSHQWEAIVSADFSTVEGFLAAIDNYVIYQAADFRDSVVIGPSNATSIDYALDGNGSIAIISGDNHWIGPLADLKNGSSTAFTYVKGPVPYSMNLYYLTDTALYLYRDRQAYRLDRNTKTFTLIYDGKDEPYNSDPIRRIADLFIINERIFLVLNTESGRTVTRHRDATTPWATKPQSIFAGEGFNWRSTVIDDQFYHATVVTTGGTSFCEARILNANGEIVSQFPNAQWMIAYREDATHPETPLLAVGTSSDGNCQLEEPTVYLFANGSTGKSLGTVLGWIRSMLITMTEEDLGLITVFDKYSSPSLRVMSLKGDKPIQRTFSSQEYFYQVF